MVSHWPAPTPGSCYILWYYLLEFHCSWMASYLRRYCLLTALFRWRCHVGLHPVWAVFLLWLFCFYLCMGLQCVVYYTSRTSSRLLTIVVILFFIRHCPFCGIVLVCTRLRFLWPWRLYILEVHRHCYAIPLVVSSHLWGIAVARTRLGFFFAITVGSFWGSYWNTMLGGRYSRLYCVYSYSNFC